MYPMNDTLENESKVHHRSPIWSLAPEDKLRMANNPTVKNQIVIFDEDYGGDSTPRREGSTRSLTVVLGVLILATLTYLWQGGYFRF